MKQRRAFLSCVAVATLVTTTALAQPGETVTIAVGVISSGQGAHLKAYLEALAATPEVRLVAIADLDGQISGMAQSVLGTKFAGSYASAQAMLAEQQPALALVSLEADRSPPAISAALEAGCHVLAEKPGCVRVEEFEQLAATAQERRLQLMLALANRLNPEVQQAAQLVRQGAIGSVYAVELHLIADQLRLTRPDYQRVGTPRRLGRRASNLAGHPLARPGHVHHRFIDLGSLRFYPRSRRTTAGGRGCRRPGRTFDNGSLGTMNSGYFLDKGYHSRIKIWGSGGWLQIASHGGIPLSWYSQREAELGVQQIDRFDQPTGYSPLVRACVRAAAGLDEPPLTTKDSLRVIRTVFASYRAADSGSRQHVP